MEKFKSLKHKSLGNHYVDLTVNCYNITPFSEYIQKGIKTFIDI